MRRRSFIKSSLMTGLVSSTPFLSSTVSAQTSHTMFDKIWDPHVVANLGGETDLLHVDFHFIHDLHARQFAALERDGKTVRSPELTYAVADHSVSTLPGRTLDSSPTGRQLAGELIASSRALGIESVGINDAGQGIVHMIGPETGLTQPGKLIVCGDSHTCTQGALGSMAWGIGSTEVRNVLISQTIIQKRPAKMRINYTGSLGPWVTAKDVILYTIGKLGADAGLGYAVEYAGPAISAMTMEERLALCNLSIEMGSRIGMIAPDDTTYEYLVGRAHSPKEQYWDAALQYWQSLPSDADAVFDREETIDVSAIEPQVTWGTSPEHVINVNQTIPVPGAEPDNQIAYEAALDYTGLTAGSDIAGTPIQRVFIGSCANSRISDLRLAAQVVKGRQVSTNVEAWIVPGSQHVKRQGEAEGIDRIFIAAGFEWREPGCSRCVATNGEIVPPGERCVSTSNRNFIGRQGRDSITHLASPATAAAAAIAGRIVDVRQLMVGELA